MNFYKNNGISTEKCLNSYINIVKLYFNIILNMFAKFRYFCHISSFSINHNLGLFDETASSKKFYQNKLIHHLTNFPVH